MKLYNELRLESLKFRRWFRKLLFVFQDYKTWFNGIPV